MTFLQQQTRVGELINQAVTDDTKTITETQVKAWLNLGYRDQINALVSINEAFNSEVSLANLVAGQAEYSLPSDFRKLIKVEIGYETSSQRATATKVKPHDLIDPQTAVSAASPVYTFTGSSLISIFPTPAENVANGLQYYYIEEVADMSADGDLPALPLGYEHLPVYFATAMAYATLGDASQQMLYLRMFNDGVANMKGELINRQGGSDYILDYDQYS